MAIYTKFCTYENIPLYGNTCMMRKVCRVLYTELFYAIIPACFHTFCCSVIPTSPYILNVFYTCLPHFYSSILDSIHSAHSTQF